MYAALLAGTHEPLAQAELDALTEMTRVKRKGRVLLFESERVERGKKAALTHFVGELVAEGGIDDVVNADISLEGSFAARAVRVPQGLDENLPALEAALGEHVLAQNEKSWVDLERPETVVKVIVTGGDCFLLKQLYECERSFAERHPAERPFFHPSSVHSKMARVLVNLAGVEEGDRVLDPFCGAGGILLEAASVGAQAFGVDADPKMAEGARKNLAYFNFPGEIQDGLAQETAKLFKFKFDAVVTDPPYGKNSSVKAGGLDNIVLAQIGERLKGGGRLVLTADRRRDEMLEGHFDVLFHYSLRVHKSLTREIYVMEAKR